MKPDAVIFDLFGTLLDIASIGAAVAPFSADPAAFVRTWREKQIAYTFMSTIMNRYEDFDALTVRSLQYAAALHNVYLSDADTATLASAWRTIGPFPDALPALSELRRAGIRCAVLTNGTATTAGAALRHAQISDAIDVTLSVDTVRAYKPSPSAYALACEQYQTSPQQLAFVTANGWDATGAAEYGMQVSWCNRTGAPIETFGAAITSTVQDLSEFVLNTLRC